MNKIYLDFAGAKDIRLFKDSYKYNISTKINSILKFQIKNELCFKFNEFKTIIINQYINLVIELKIKRLQICL
jgi:hypothetical protein